jgi:predicted ABC-type ATPase
MPRVVVLAGINGAGKTTASRDLLVNVLKIPVFTNADAIARGLNSLNPESEAFRAGRVMLDWMHDLAKERRDFAFETTLSARTYAGWLSGLRDSGYEVQLYYYWLRSAEVAIARVAQRVRSGGHHIPDADVLRRYGRSVKNFLDLYRGVADIWEVFDNTDGDRRLLAIGNSTDQIVESDDVWDSFTRSAGHANH